MANVRGYSDGELEIAVANSRSWRGLLRELGLKATSAGAQRSVRARVEELGLDHSHFTGQRRWSEDQLAAAVSNSRTWSEVAESLGLAGGSGQTALKGHAARLGLDVSHMGDGSVLVERPSIHDALVPRIENLARAGSMHAATFLLSCGCDVSWPLEPVAYDLLVNLEGGIKRVQVKTTTRRANNTWIVSISRSARNGPRRVYDTDELDYFFVIDGDLNYYLIPVDVVGGLSALHVSRYDRFRVGKTSDLSRPVQERRILDV